MEGLLPDFLVIGAMKAGTSSLHEQLAARPGLFLSRPKEPNFFSDDEVYARGESWYRSLFAEAAGRRCGESSTHYSKLPRHPHTVERMRKLLPRPRLVYVMRHPIDRIVSHYVHEWSEGRCSGAIDEVVSRDPSYVAYSSYARQLEPYLEAYGSEALLPVFFERLMRDRDAELARICRFVGDPDWQQARWRAGQGAANVSAERLRKTPLTRLLLGWGPAVAARRLVPPALRRRVKRRWQMSERPELSAPVRERLAVALDPDLARLGAWLGLELSCRSWSRQVLRGEPRWAEVA